MGNDPKYLVFDTHFAGPTVFVFPNFVGHDDVARMVQSQYPGWELLSGGFCDVSSEKVTVYGRSSSLNVKANPEQDGGLILRQIRSHGGLL